MKRARFYLVRLPIISIVVFLICCIIAAIIYPGSHKEIIEYKSEVYSFTHNFLSELGSLKTNTDETNPKIIQEDNTPSMILFNGSLILIGVTLMLFYIEFKKIFSRLRVAFSIKQTQNFKLDIEFISELGKKVRVQGFESIQPEVDQQTDETEIFQRIA